MLNAAATLLPTLSKKAKHLDELWVWYLDELWVWLEEVPDDM